MTSLVAPRDASGVVLRRAGWLERVRRGDKNQVSEIDDGGTMAGKTPQRPSTKKPATKSIKEKRQAKQQKKQQKRSS